MPRRQPFTALCRSLAQDRTAGWIDLHVHSTASDGLYTPAQVVDLARRSGLAGVALTDHDTVEGVPAVRRGRPTVGARNHSRRGNHGGAPRARDALAGLLHPPRRWALVGMLGQLRQHRVGRFWTMVDRLCERGMSLDRDALERHVSTGTLGRRRLAEYLVQRGRAATVQDAFRRYLGDREPACVPNIGLPAAEAIALVRGAGGVAAWAHPSYDCSREVLRELCSLGLGGLEVHYPGHRPARARELKALADEFGLAATGGSDCHGPDRGCRAIGACGVSASELAGLRRRAAS